jgi:hypothetical protein
MTTTASATAAVLALDSVSFAAEMLSLEIGDRESVLTPVELTSAILLATNLQKQLREFERKLPKLKRKTVEQYRGPKTPVHRRALDQCIGTEVNGQATAHKKAKR